MIYVTQAKSNRNALTPLEIPKNSRKKIIFLTGLTFIEIFLVIIIISVLVGISLPNTKKTFNNLQLNSFTRQLQDFMNYLHERAIVEEKIIYLNIDKENNEYWAKIQDGQDRLRTYSIPEELTIEIIKKIDTGDKQILFLPDGSIDKVTIKINNRDNQSIILTTEGLFGKAKIQTQE